jgi:hypothetical protein
MRWGEEAMKVGAALGFFGALFVAFDCGGPVGTAALALPAATIFGAFVGYAWTRREKASEWPGVD